MATDLTTVSPDDNLKSIKIDKSPIPPYLKSGKNSDYEQDTDYLREK